MGVIPMQEDVGQELYTRDHGTVKVDKLSWMDGGFHIVLCPNGAYRHANGLPIKDEKELRAAFGPNKEDLERAIHWFRNRHDEGENAPRPIVFRGDNTPMFSDGTIPEEADLFNFFSPGPILAAAIVALHEYKKRAPENVLSSKKVKGAVETMRSREPAEVVEAPKSAKKPVKDKVHKLAKPAPMGATG